MNRLFCILRTFFKNFLLCGTVGWCMEICFTALGALRRRDSHLTGQTSLWMFPIYGCAALMAPLCRLLAGNTLRLRGTVYMGLIFLVEFFSGILLGRHNLRPWDYGHSRFHVRRVIRLDYAPVWFCTGLFFEYILNRKKPDAKTRKESLPTDKDS